MPAPSTIVLADGATTPVNRSFDPANRSANGAFTYWDTSSGNYVTSNMLMIATALPNPASRGEKNFRVKLNVALPVGSVLPANPDQTILAYMPRSSVEFVIPERATLQDRKHLLAITKNLLAHAIMNDVVRDLKSLY